MARLCPLRTWLPLPTPPPPAVLLRSPPLRAARPNLQRTDARAPAVAVPGSSPRRTTCCTTSSATATRRNMRSNSLLPPSLPQRLLPLQPRRQMPMLCLQLLLLYPSPLSPLVPTMPRRTKRHLWLLQSPPLPHRLQPLQQPRPQRHPMLPLSQSLRPQLQRLLLPSPPLSLTSLPRLMLLPTPALRPRSPKPTPAGRRPRAPLPM